MALKLNVTRLGSITSSAPPANLAGRWPTMPARTGFQPRGRLNASGQRVIRVPWSIGQGRMP